MKLIITGFLYFLVFFSGFTQPIIRHALLIGIGQYPKSSKWPILHSDQDATRLKKELKKNGMLERNIQLLCNEEASYNNIRLAFKKLADEVEPEDQIVIYLGGHSQKISDVSNDEPDGFDESFVAYDAEPINVTGGNNGGNHFLDDELSKWISILSKKITRYGSLFILYDGGISTVKPYGIHSKGTFGPYIISSRFTTKEILKNEGRDNEWLDISYSPANNQIVSLDPGKEGGRISEIQVQPKIWGSPLVEAYIDKLSSQEQGKLYRSLKPSLEKVFKAAKIQVNYTLDGDINKEIFRFNPKQVNLEEPGQESENDSAHVYCVVIGISSYLRIDKLQYGHTDARYFADVLQNAFKERLPSENQYVFLDSMATSNPIYMALESLSQRVKENDKVYFYFAGHGDVESLITKRAHLLLFDSPPNVYKSGGTLSVEGLKDYLADWTYKKAKVFLVIDACRSGNLAGGIEGQGVAMNSIQDLDLQSARLLSCQPNEKSIESTSFGGGHGAFTYYLVKGIKGGANSNGDKNITVGEIGTFLSDSVSVNTSLSQNPLIEGNKRISFLPVAANDPFLYPNNGILAGNREKIEVHEEDSLKTLWIKELRSEIAAGHFLKPESHCAKKTLDRILNKWPLEIKFHQPLKNELGSALVLTSQKLINEYIEGNENVADEELFAEGSREMEYLLELIDIDNPLYFTYLARKYFFEGRSLRPNLVTNDQKRYQLKTALRNLETSLKYEPEGAQNYNAIGRLLQANNQFDAAIGNYKKAIQLAPRWKFPIQNLGTAFYEFAKAKSESTLFDSAIIYFEKSVEIDPDYALAYCNLGRTYTKKGNNYLAKKYYQKALFLNSARYDAYMLLGEIYRIEEKWDSAQYYLQQGLLIMPNNSDLRTNLGNVYCSKMFAEESPDLKLKYSTMAKKQYLIAKSLDSLNEFALAGIGNIYWEESKMDSALYFYEKCVSLDSSNIEYNVYVIEALCRTGKSKVAEKKAFHLLKTFHKETDASMLWYELGVISAAGKDFKTANSRLQKAISLGFTDIFNYEGEPLLDDFRKTDLYKTLKKKLR